MSDLLSADWFLNGATVATDNHVILTPSIAQRYGVFMHTMPIDTSDFEILFDVSVGWEYLMFDIARYKLGPIGEHRVLGI